MKVLVLPLAATGSDPEEGAVARQIAREAAARIALGEGVDVQLAIPVAGEGGAPFYAVAREEPTEEGLAGAAGAAGADAALSGALRLEPGHLWWRARLVRADGAPLALWEEATPLPQASLVAAALAARALRELGSQVPAEAAGAFAEGVRAEPTRAAAWRLHCIAADALAAEDSGVALPDAREPLQGLLAALRLDPGFAAPRDALIAFARLALDGPHMPAAFTALGALCELRPSDAGAHALLALYALHHGRPDEARAELLAAETASPRGPELVTLGEVADALGDAAAAEKWLRRAADLRREDPEAQRALGRFLARRGDLPGALPALACALALDDSALSHLDYGRALALKGEVERARHHLKLAEELAGDDDVLRAEAREWLEGPPAAT